LRGCDPVIRPVDKWRFPDDRPAGEALTGPGPAKRRPGRGTGRPIRGGDFVANEERREAGTVFRGTRRRRLIAAIVLVFHTLGILSSVHAIMNTRTEQGAVAWALALNTVPYVAVPAYWVLGRSRFQGYVDARQLSEVVGEDLLARTRDRMEPYRIDAEEIDPAVRAAQQLAGQPVLTENHVELLVDGDVTFDSILAGIDAATEYVLFEFFIVKDDDIGRQVKARLIARAREGVRVYFLYDEVGSHSLPDSYKDELREAGIEVFPFNTRKGPGNRFQLNFRNHRKVVVVDGKVAWIGGHNVGDEYLGRDPGFGHWRDTHLRIEGPAALGAQLSFAEDWHWATDEILSLAWTPHPASQGDAHVLIVPTGPADELETASLMFTHAINTARERIWISSPYFVPDQSVMKALQLAGLRGVDVRILIPDKPDHYLVYLAAFSYFEDAGRTGVRFFRYRDGFLHQKAMLIDDAVAAIGTANFDNRSFRLNFEITAVITGNPEFLARVERMFENDFGASREVPYDELSTKPWWFRFGVRLAWLTSPVQ
jgi:cardiolipin synthase